jgi:hypothetical protein
MRESISASDRHNKNDENGRAGFSPKIPLPMVGAWPRRRPAFGREERRRQRNRRQNPLPRSPKGPKPQEVIFSVKGGSTGVKDVRDPRGVIERDKAAIGVLITMQEPTSPMKKEAAEVERPPTLALDETYKRAPKAKPKAHEQPGLGI